MTVSGPARRRLLGPRCCGLLVVLALCGALAPSAQACLRNIEQLRPLCQTALRCEAGRTGVLSALGASAEDQAWVSRQLRQLREQSHRWDCEQQQRCYAEAQTLCVNERQLVNGFKSASWLQSPGWKRRERVRNLARAATGDERPPRFEELVGGYAIAAELTRQVYDLRCDNPIGCLRALAADDDHNAALLRQQIEAARETTDMQAVAAASAEVAARQQLEASRQGAQQIAQAQETAGLSVAQAVLEGLVSESRASKGQPVNLTDAVQQLGEDQLLIAEHSREGLALVAEAILAAAQVQRPPGEGGVIRQIDPEADLDRVYGKRNRVEYGVLLVPDPRIPRHRRGYDQTLSAVASGMLAADFVLDRYAMPWQKYLDDLADGHNDPRLEGQGADNGRFGILIYRRDDFRDPESCPKPVASVDCLITLRVLYVVAESATYGVQAKAFQRALLRVERAIAAAPDRAADLQQNQNAFAATRNQAHCAWQLVAADWCWGSPVPSPAGRALVIGPNFSGSMAGIANAWQQTADSRRHGGLTSATDLASLRRRLQTLGEDEFSRLGKQRFEMARARLEISRRAERAMADLRIDSEEIRLLQSVVPNPLEKAPRWQELADHLQCWSNRSAGGGRTLGLLSAHVTAESNFRLAASNLQLYSHAIPDSEKLREIDRRFPATGNREDIVLFYENSAFGAGLCSKGPVRFCERALRVPFPSNISDLRMRSRERARKAEERALDQLGLPHGDWQLDLAEGAENGSEYPDSQRSLLTSASVERELEATLAAIRLSRPRLVVVAASDVRDRIYLFDRLRGAVPHALLVDLEADVLMAHPRILHATRGMLLLSSARLSPSTSTGSAARFRPLLAFSNDGQRLLHDLVAGLGTGLPTRPDSRVDCLLSTPEWLRKVMLTARTQTAHHGFVQAPDGCLLRAPPAAQPAVLGYLPSSRGLTLLDAQTWSCENVPQLVAVLWVWILVGYWMLARQARLGELQSSVQQASSGDAISGLLGALGAVAVPAYLLLDGGRDDGFDLPLAVAVVVMGLGVALLLGYRLYLDWADRKTLLADSPPLVLGPFNSIRLRSPDLMAWPLLVGFLIFTMMSVDIIRRHIGWPLPLPMTPASRGGALVLLAGVLCAIGLALVAFWHASSLFRNLLASVERLRQLVMAGGHAALPDWATIGGPQWCTVRGSDPPLLTAWADAACSTAPRQLWPRPRFARTPALADPVDFAWPLCALQRTGRVSLDDLRQRLLHIDSGYEDGLQVRLAYSVFFASVVASIRTGLITGLITLSVVVAAGFVFPFSDRDDLLLLSLGLLAIATLFSGVVVLQLERQPVISRLLSNTPAGLQLSWPLVVSLLSPLLLTILAVLVLQLPGVLEWSGGILGRVFGFLGWGQ